VGISWLEVFQAKSHNPLLLLTKDSDKKELRRLSSRFVLKLTKGLPRVKQIIKPETAADHESIPTISLFLFKTRKKDHRYYDKLLSRKKKNL